MLRAFLHFGLLARTTASAAVRFVSIAGPTCHASGAAEKTAFRLTEVCNAIASGDQTAAVFALIYALGNLALFVESTATAYSHARKILPQS